MPLVASDRLGPYEIVALIGKGGMGEVYRARDTKLERDVAIKVLPEALAADRDRVVRFEREAKLLASLNHPNIAAIYGFESSADVHFLVLELVPGDTLAERVAKGALPIEDALAIALGIAEALEEAHERGIVHRDLKPANVKVTPDGKIKVLDFGLGKVFAEETPAADTSLSPTLTRDGTRVGTILGTAAYMSPEQARGKSVDKRSDIFSFGSLLYEMLTGRKAFDGDEVSDILAAVLKSEPDLDALHPSARALVRRCLVKDAKDRWRDIGDVRVELQQMEKRGTEATAPQRSSPPARGAVWVSAALSGLLVGLAVWLLRPQPSPPSVPLTRFSVVLPEDQTLATGRRGVAVSPDGSKLAYRAADRVYLRSLNELEGVPVRGTEGSSGSIFFSPDEAFIGFYADGSLKKVPLSGGVAVTLCSVESPYDASWESDGTILYAAGTEGIWRVSENGGTPELLVAPDSESAIQYDGAQLLPGGEAVLFTTGTADWDEAQIVTERLATKERRTLIERGRAARYLATGHLLYFHEGTLYAAAFDAERLELTGAPVPVVEHVAVTQYTGGVHFAASRSGSGTLTYVPELSVAPIRRLTWRDRSGRRLSREAPVGLFTFSQSSPDGGRVAVGRRGDRGEDVWLFDVERETWTRLTFEGGATNPKWTPDGASVIFARDEGGLFSLAPDGGHTPVRLTESSYRQHMSAISPNGRWLVFHEHGPDFGPWVFDLEGREARRKIEDKAGMVAFSPDGNWVAYDSSGEVYVEPFPGPGGRFQVSRDGGIAPKWRRPDELIFLDGRKVMSVEVVTSPAFSAATPKVLFETPDDPGAFFFDVADDAQRFLVPERTNEGSAAQQIHVVLNWTSELERLVPTR